MESATSQFKAGKFTVLITNDSEGHPARVWAELTADRLVECGPYLMGQKAKQALTLRHRIVEVLQPLYGQPRRPKIDRVIELIQQASADTPWAQSFHHPELVALIRAEIERNLNTIYGSK